MEIETIFLCCGRGQKPCCCCIPGCHTLIRLSPWMLKKYNEKHTFNAVILGQSPPPWCVHWTDQQGRDVQLLRYVLGLGQRTRGPTRLLYCWTSLLVLESQCTIAKHPRWSGFHPSLNVLHQPYCYISEETKEFKTYQRAFLSFAISPLLLPQIINDKRKEHTNWKNKHTKIILPK